MYDMHLVCLHLLCSCLVVIFHSLCCNFRGTYDHLMTYHRWTRERVVIQIKLTKKDIEARSKMRTWQFCRCVQSACDGRKKTRHLTTAIAGLRSFDGILATCTRASNSLQPAAFVNFVNAGCSAHSRLNERPRALVSIPKAFFAQDTPCKLAETCIARTLIRKRLLSFVERMQLLCYEVMHPFQGRIYYTCESILLRAENDFFLRFLLQFASLISLN